MDENSNFRKENEGELSAFSTEHLAVGYDKMPLIKDVNLQVPGRNPYADRTEWFRKIHYFKNNYTAVEADWWYGISGKRDDAWYGGQ